MLQNSCDYINYSIELFKDGKKLRSFASSSLELDLKNAIESGEYRFVVTAKVLGLNLVKTSEISRTIEILRKDYTISQAIEKVYDGDSKLKQNGNDYVVVSLNPSEEVIENFKIVGTYNSSKIDANEILITDISALDDASVENYNFTFDFTGSITKKNLSLNIGDYSQNTKQFDGEIFEKDFNNDIATGLVENETLSLNVSTKQSDVGQYSFENSALDYTVSIYNQLGEEVTSCYDISLSGGMEIGKEVFSTQGLSLSDLEVVYDAQPHLVLLNGRENLLPGIEIEYSFQIDGKEQEVIFDGDSLIVAPIEVGTYTIVANIISNGNYSISGETSFSATLKINLQKNNFVFWRLKFEGVGIKTFEVNSKQDSLSISNLPLVKSHYLKGTISTNNGKVGKYVADELQKNLKVFDDQDVDVSDNYEIVCLGSIEIVHFYYISFDKNNLQATGTMPKMQVNLDATVNLYSNAFKREGYSFVEWNTKSDGSGQSYMNLQAVTNLTEIHKMRLFCMPFGARQSPS